MKKVVYQGRMIPLGNITEYNFKYVKQIPYKNRHGRVVPVGGLPWKEWVEKQYANSFYQDIPRQDAVQVDQVHRQGCEPYARYAMGVPVLAQRIREGEEMAKKLKYLKYLKVHLRHGLCYRIERWNTFEPNYVRRWFAARRRYWKGKCP